MLNRFGMLLSALVLLAAPLGLRADDDSTVTFTSRDGLVQLVMPAGWVQQQSSNPGAAIEARNEDYDAFVMVLIENRDDPYMLLADYAKGRRDEVLSHLVKSKCSDPESIDVNSYKAIRYEIHGTSPISREDFGYFLTIVQMRRHYVEVVSWAVEKHFPENASILKDSAKNVGYKEE
jgi:hypothetical protein